ncbi:ornithine cyclodeaminase [Tropicibacter sp. R15_0]|uniref:ornithine cyclodeaminase family protein n=1 Tax=Tropicibacter sp. R15_0 TaxID=2821101 RepID=UPI001AD95344|nr:ornithine cyclodeaminase [Tropicibacter sp. R15_0]MBO9465943.1 ornithine cyclodeaminase [Tropicibacter sp. R15_0]
MIIIPFAEGEANLDWLALTDALAAGHALPKAEIADTFLYRGKDTLLNRSAWIDGLGVAVKAATVFPDNPTKGEPMINGAVNLFNDATGALEALVDFHLVTKWKTAGDSLLAARRLARPDSRNILIVGAGTVGRSLHAAYSAAFPDAEFTLWNRTASSGQAMADDLGIHWQPDLQTAMAGADIITSATMSTTPVIKGDWIQPGTHVDLIGAYRPDMREADDTALQRARLFVDSFDTTLEHIGELKEPLATGAITRDHVLADYYQLDAFTRQSDEEITMFKNGGGAHLDLMVGRYILDCWTAAQGTQGS